MHCKFFSSHYDSRVVNYKYQVVISLTTGAPILVVLDTPLLFRFDRKYFPSRGIKPSRNAYEVLVRPLGYLLIWLIGVCFSKIHALKYVL